MVRHRGSQDDHMITSRNFTLTALWRNTKIVGRKFMQTNPMLARLVAVVLFMITMGKAHAGSVIGVVKFSGAIPKLPTVVVSKDQDYCGDFLANDTYLIDENGNLQNAVVFLDPAQPGLPPDAQKLNLIENDGCRYIPRVKAMQKGERLRIKNNDPKLHIPHGYLKDKTIFMLSLPFKNTALEATQKIREPGVLKLVCDTHAWMLGYLHVFDHPYFAVSDESGGFKISNIPAGRYTLHAWHEDAGVRTQEVLVTDTGEIRIVFEFSKQ
jgi:hypothetical protein